jgi:Domain of unknown function (DUF3883)
VSSAHAPKHWPLEIGTLNPEQITPSKRLILAGLYLSKYDKAGLRRLGFKNFAEAFNVLGYAMGAKPASVKNYRDEFDPLLPNPRSGWHKRPRKEYCLRVFEQFQDLDFDTFTALVRSFVGHDENAISIFESKDERKVDGASFVKRLVTGLAAENYFEAIQPKLLEFKDCILQNTTRLGCGYDFKLTRKSDADFLAAEVKGLQDRTGSLVLTPKEYDVASSLSDRFFLFVVKNFRERPVHEIYRNPVSSRLKFTRKERVVVQVSWSATI